MKRLGHRTIRTVSYKSGDTVKFRQCSGTLICKECSYSYPGGWCNIGRENIDDDDYVRGVIIDSIYNPHEERVECNIQVKDKTISVVEKHVEEDDEAPIANKSW